MSAAKVVTDMPDNRRLSEEYDKIGRELIASDEALEKVRNSHATIVFLASDAPKTDKGRLVLGQCEKVADKYKWGIPADFTITLFEPNLAGKSDEAIRRVILHELLHVGIMTSEDSDEVYTVLPHDLEDFKLMIDRYGTDWDKVGQENPDTEIIMEEVVISDI